jgi:heme/copper-type cytochrome/quinol oxidase subunit 2
MEYSDEAIETVWGISLLIAAVVITVVALLLGLISMTARKIQDAAGEIWIQGKFVANNTIHIPIFLATTNRVVGEVLASAQDVLKEARKVQHHIEECTGCPDCMNSEP